MFKPTDADWERLSDFARNASGRAWAPYSGFCVGAAVLTRYGAIRVGANIENASYGLTVCAERVAVWDAWIRHHDRPIGVAIYTPTPTPAAPCGACRQVLHEFGGGDLRVISVCDGPQRIDCLLVQLLPAAFGPADLEPKRHRVPVNP